MNIRDSAFMYLEHRSRTVKEMEIYLSAKGFDKYEITDTISELENFNYLNDEEYVIAYIDYSLRKKRGKLRMIADLQQKGVADDKIRDGFLAYEDERGIDISAEEEILARKEASDILGESELDRNILGKIGRHLSNLGYDQNIIYKIIGEITEGKFDD